jgi:hypothetical protein
MGISRSPLLPGVASAREISLYHAGVRIEPEPRSLEKDVVTLPWHYLKEI